MRWLSKKDYKEVFDLITYKKPSVKKIRKERDRYKVNARKVLYIEVRSGRIKKEKCSVDKNCRGRIEAHHEDYNKPLEVVWFCKKHHDLHHVIIRRQLSTV